MWRALIQASGKERDDKLRVFPGASASQINRVEQVLAITLPDSLKQLLLETNGVITEYGEFIWSIERIERDNLMFRDKERWAELYMPFDCLLFFGSKVNGDQSAFRVLRGKAEGFSIFLWDHESDSRTCVAGHLQSFVERWLKREIDNC